MDTYPIHSHSLEKFYHIEGEQLGRHYKEYLSNYSTWNQKEHADKWLVFPDNIGTHVSIDETSVSNGELYTIITNKAARGQRGCIIAIIEGVSSEVVIQTIEEHIRQLQTVTDFSHLVMDSAGYTEKSLKSCGDTLLWVSRVPENFSASKEVIVGSYDNWQKLSEGYEYVALERTVYEIEQRWLLVYSQAAYEREMISLRKDFGKKSEAEFKSFIKLCHEVHETENAAQKVLDLFSKKCKYLSVNQLDFEKKPVYDRKGRPNKTDIPTEFHYFIRGEAYTKMETFEKMADTKGKFIIATNDFDKQNFSDLQCFQTYKGQSKVERGFRFLKDPQFLASTIFVKKPERVEALLFIMTTCLTVYAAIEYRIRQQLEQQKLTFPNQLGKQVKNPTARWIFQCFSNITLLFNDTTQNPLILNLKPNNLFIINLLGENYYKYYFSP